MNDHKSNCSSRKSKKKKKASKRSTWDIGVLNPQWRIDPHIRSNLPSLLTAAEENEVDDKFRTNALGENFLKLTQLSLPRVLKSCDGSQKKLAQKKSINPFDEVKHLSKSDENDSLTPETTAKYFNGLESKIAFRNVYKKVSAQKYLLDGSVEEFEKDHTQIVSQLFDPESMTDVEPGIFSGKLTARHKFAAYCNEAKTIPNIGLLLRKELSPCINLSHMSIGDTNAVLLSKCLLQTPLVTSLNLRDNRLHDEGISSIVQCIINKKDLYNLDLSQNKIDGKAASDLAKFLASSSCYLTTLSLSKADLDDGEVLDFAEAVSKNQTLTELDLSHNLIGSAESLNVVQPDLTTGGEAFAEMLSSNNTLMKLDLSWNILRLNSAVELGMSIAINNGLKVLNLSYNAFGNDGAQAIGDALMSNNCLERLDLSNNNIPCQGAFVIAGALTLNSTLNFLKLDGNPLGSLGGRTLLQAVTNSENKFLMLSIQNCNFDSNNDELFDPDQATGTYDLNLSNPYERSIALELLRLANKKEGCKFLSIQHTIQDKKINRAINVELKDVPVKRNRLIKGRTEKRNISSAVSDKEKLIHLFQELDADGSGAIDVDELEIGLKRLGIVSTPSETLRLIAQYDIDGTGTVEQDEFLDLMSTFSFKEVVAKEVVDISTGYVFEIPIDGQLKVEFVDLHIPVEDNNSKCTEGVSRLIENLQGNPNALQMLNMAKNGMYMKTAEAQLLLDSVLEKEDKVNAMEAIIPHVIMGRNAIALIETNLSNEQRLKLQTRLGQSFGPIVGIPTGHYKIDLNSEQDRLTARKLTEISNKTMIGRKSAGLKDTSQHGNYLGYRNELFNGKPIVLTSSFCDKLPKFGVLEFDFVYMERPPQNTPAASNSRFQQILERLNLKRFKGKGGDDAKHLTSISARKQSLSNTSFRKIKTVKCFDTLVDMQRRRSHLILPDDITRSGDTVVIESEDQEHKTVFSSRRLILDLQALLCSRWINVRQAIQLIKVWPDCFLDSRIDVVMILYSRIVDLYNFYKLQEALNEEEAAACYFRLGWLNIWSPLSPDEYYELDLSLYEQRQIAKMLVKLAIDEPGENWQNESFGWTRTEAVPGWELNMSWLRDDGFPEKGYLRLQYYSGSDLGCAPVWPTRKELCQNVLAEIPENFEEFASKMNIMYSTLRIHPTY